MEILWDMIKGEDKEPDIIKLRRKVTLSACRPKMVEHFHCAEWLYYYLKNKRKLDVSSEGPSSRAFARNVEFLFIFEGRNITTQHSIFTLVLPTLVQTVLIFSLSVTVFCSLFSLSCDSEFNSSTSMNVVIGSVWSSLMGSFTFFSDRSSSKDTVTAESLLPLDSVSSRPRQPADHGNSFFAPLKSISKMNANKDKGISLLHNISLNDKDKLKWTGTFQALQMFVEEGLNISDGIWSSPGGDSKQFKAKDIDLRWYSDSQSITLNGKLKEPIKEQLISLASVSKRLRAVKESEAGNQDSHNENVSFEQSSESEKSSESHSLENLNNQLEALNKAVFTNTAAIKSLIENTNDSKQPNYQELENEIGILKEKNRKLTDTNANLKNENSDLEARINNLTYILADLQGKAKSAEQEKESLITAMRLLVEDSNNEPNATIKNYTDETSKQSETQNSADCAGQTEEVLNPNIQVSNIFPTLTSRKAMQMTWMLCRMTSYRTTNEH